VAFPTDTVYGLGCDPWNDKALRKLKSIKDRRREPFPVLVASQALANRIAVMDKRANALASRFWPGPLTMVLRPKVNFPHSLTMRRKTIAIRCPRNRFALKLIKKCGGLLTGTSANITGRAPCAHARAVRQSLGDRIDAVVDGGPSPIRRSSTVIRVYSRRVRIVRKGPILGSQIRRVLLGADRSRRTR
jgi:L-threonylcarbamoyladenylate synthase